MFSKKSIVLNNLENLSKKAIITVECDGYETTGKLRLYNFSQEPLGILSLGIYHNGKVEKAGLTRIENMVYQFGCNLNSLPQTFSCAVVNFTQGQSKPILFGTSEGCVEVEQVLDNVLSAVRESKTSKDVEEILNQSGLDYDDQLKEEIEKEIDKCIGDCENCEYKKFYFANVKTQSDMIGEEDEKKDNNQTHFYAEIKEQIDSLFASNPTEEHLENIISNSKWVKVKVDEEGNYYVLGLIYEEETLKYICYGVPGVYQKNPPRQLSGYPIWVPLEEDKPQNFGYWLSYQDASNGDSVRATII